ncbi:hypothetical protein B6U57_06175 [Ligilactobacillus salivarius]|uniref:hypothetical protein n=1 Tax=Ligilactobacillus salivarius TaxID=1624 RepID=UPI0009DA4121|nr:hypothetical protein [Ligilactobacillus salivarius]OQQ87434.1 hypothetical protein B6U57_06175 [Ligilactobacillus salivarius]
MIEFNWSSSKNRLQNHVNNMKTMMEIAITKKKIEIGGVSEKKTFKNGREAKTSLIRSQKLIYELHEFVKEELYFYGINKDNIYPPIGEAKPEIKMTGLFKQKDQDVCVVPSKIKNKKELITWGPLANTGIYTDYGQYKEERILATNVRSQLSSIEKNSDTLFERMIAEAFNLHYQYPNLVLGELYMIPVYEYEDNKMLNNSVGFKSKHSPIEKYIKFFSYLNDYSNKNDAYKYTKAGLVIVDFNRSIPKIYENTLELKKDGLVDDNFDLDLSKLSPISYVYDLLESYNSIWGIDKLD